MFSFIRHQVKRATKQETQLTPYMFKLDVFGKLESPNRLASFARCMGNLRGDKKRR